MITFPNIKINLGLSITEKRPDGYHNLETVFYPVALEDALEIRTNPEAQQKFTLHQHGMEIAGNPENNLVVKAYLLLDKEFHLPPVEIHLYKHIPSGAGLGGGSSDAAFMVKLLNEHYNLQMCIIDSIYSFDIVGTDTDFTLVFLQGVMGEMLCLGVV